MNCRRITTTIVLALAAIAGAPAMAFWIGPPIDPQVTVVVEYRNDTTGHYFLAADDADKSAIDSGAAGAGWHTTGFQFSAFVPGAGRASGEVCRFYAPSPNSHFYTADPYECNLLISHPESGWIYEGVKFEVARPVAGACTSTTTTSQTPVRRLYNNRFQFNDSAHRYLFDPVTADALIAAGWIDEGIVFCPDTATRLATQQFSFVPDAIRSRADCENEDLNAHIGCIGLDGMSASLPNRIGPYFPPFYVVNNPQWTDAFITVTGYYYDLYTAQDPNSQSAVLAHSFIQLSQSTQAGFHLSSVDRTAPSIASMDAIYQFKTRPPQPAASDARVFPWLQVSPDAGYLELHFAVSVPTFVGGNGQGHAWGSPMIEFRDVKSGQSIDVTLQAFGSIPPGDFSGIAEPQTGNVFVSTVFRADPAFGERVAGDFTLCPGATCGGSYTFRIRTADFDKVIATARQTNPALSTQPGDYTLTNFRFRFGVYDSADLGATLTGLSLTVF